MFKSKMLLVFAALALTFSVGSPVSRAAEPRKPNIVIIVGDDLGYCDIGAFGSEIKTPSLDALAEQGVRFTQFYTHASCSPT